MFYKFFMKLFTRYTNNANNRVDNKYRAKIMGFDKNISIAPGACVRPINKDSIGHNCFIGLYSYINGDVTIEDDVWIGPYCSLPSGNHLYDPNTKWFSKRTSSDDETQRIVIGRGSWLASGVTVTGGVTIGKVNLICANAVVTKDTPDYAIMAGTPAKVVGTICKETGKYLWRKDDERE